jgi:hypothetical protein
MKETMEMIKKEPSKAFKKQSTFYVTVLAHFG